MPDFGKLFLLLALVWATITFLFNFILPNPPHIFGDIYLRKPGFKVYVSFTSAIVLSAILSVFFNFFRG